MLKVEYPFRETFSSYQNQSKPAVVTWVEAKKHLHEVRQRRQNELALNIEECHRLQTIHKQMFNHKVDSFSNEKLPNIKPIKSINNEYASSTNKYSIPRLEYASIIYRKAIPSFELEPPSKLDNSLPIVNALVHNLSETQNISSTPKIANNPLLLSVKNDQQRCLSVSPVPSIDKRANKVYEKWPDYNQISEIVGYRINPSSKNKPTSDAVPSGPSTSRGKRKTPTRFPGASKQIKNLISLNSTSMRRNLSKAKQPMQSNMTPATNDKSSLGIEPLKNTPAKEIKPKLPNIICPSSIAYSSRAQTRQWLLKHNFSGNAMHTVPLL
ncbi:unnamed protein product [Rotaria magnacalcarata]|uniref:Uncharacterized protein n=1 Tax=Rotaria magnacalcarata TaxID=392030 RepID=A0A819ITM7_9BILA|nr:unnamed protein product [Rotaria magnacalcarata]CAF3919113.1 unnamed protein product [Rotaria magnacalcarata]